MPAEALLEWHPEVVRPSMSFAIVETGWAPWYKVFKIHHYLADARQMPFSTAYTAFDEETGDAVAFMGMSGMAVNKKRVARACRLVVHPEFQGAGVGLRFLNTLVERERQGEGFIGAPVPSYMHTAHPALCAALRRSPLWTQVSQKLVGDRISGPRDMVAQGVFFGGHLRSVAGFRYDGPEQ